MCHVLHYSCNVNAAVADSLHCRMICGTVHAVQLSFKTYKDTLHSYNFCDMESRGLDIT